MNIPLIIGEAGLKINERILEVISDLKIKAHNFGKDSQEYGIIHRCIGRLETLNNEIYTKVLGEFIESMTALPKEKPVIEETVDGVINTLSRNLAEMSPEKHEKAFELFKSLDDEEHLRSLLQSLSDPRQMATIAKSLQTFCQ